MINDATIAVNTLAFRTNKYHKTHGSIEEDLQTLGLPLHLVSNRRQYSWHTLWPLAGLYTASRLPNLAVLWKKEP